MWKNNTFFLFLLVILGTLFRLYHLNFGLPHTFYADEPEFAELAIMYTYQIKSIIANNDYFKLIPISYVYGTVPTYFLTASLMVFSKSLNFLQISFDKYTIYVFFRLLMVVASMAIIWKTAILAKRVGSQDNLAIIATTALLALNYKLIVMAHYVNADVLLTALLLGSFIFFHKYLLAPDNRNLFISAILFGLAVGTKITALISLPIYLALIIKKRDIYGFPGFILSAMFAFIITNPFPIVFFGDFSYRIYSMLSKENGMVFDSVDYSPLKYVFGLVDMVSLPVLLLFIYEIFGRIRAKKIGEFDGFLLANFVLYFVFFSLQSRRVDRWLLPVLPIVLMYAGFGFTQLFSMLKNNMAKTVFVILIFGIYLIKPVILLTQFQRWTPKSQAYLWVKANLPHDSKMLVYTEEGLDPLGRFKTADVIQFNVYVSEGAALAYPQDPSNYDYVILSSRPMENFKRSQVAQAFPNYTRAWIDFEQTILNPHKFELIKEFTLSKPHLIPLSDVFVYKRL